MNHFMKYLPFEPPSRTNKMTIKQRLPFIVLLIIVFGSILHAAPAEQVVSANVVLTLLFTTLAVMGLIFGIVKLLLKHTKIKTSAMEIRELGAVTISLMVGIVTVVSLILNNNIKRHIQVKAGKSVEVLLHSTEKQLSLWIEHSLHQTVTEAHNSEMYPLLIEALSSNPDPKAQKKLDSLFLHNRSDLDYIFLLIDTSGKTVASSQKSLIGKISPLKRQYPQLLQKAFSGLSVFVPPVIMDDTISLHEPIQKSSLFFIIPVKDTAGETVAIYARGEAPEKEFSSIFASAKSGSTGELYAFDTKGRLISSSRFKELLHKLSLIPSVDQEILNLEIRDPLVDLTKGRKSKIKREEQPYTHMARSALQKKSKSNNKGYRDYRGVKVMGSWQWFDEYNIGIASEIDYSEAMESYYQIRMLAIVLIGITLILAIAATLMSILFGENTKKELEKANDELENRVTQRTAELLSANKNLENTIESLTQPFYVIDANSYEIIIANKAAKELCQEPEKRPHCYELTHDLPSPCSAPDHPCPLEIVKNTNEPTVVEHTHHDENGALHYIEYHGYPVFNENGELAQIIEYSIDITERKEYEKQLQKLSMVVEQSPLSIVITNCDGIIEYVNPFFYTLTGYSSYEAIGQNPGILNAGHHPKEFYTDLWQTITAGKTWHGEFCNKKKNGEIFWESASISPIIDELGNISHFIALKEDITEKKRADVELLESQERFRFSLESMGAFYWVDDLKKGTTEFDSPKFFTQFGYSKEEIPHTIEAYIKLIHPEDVVHTVQSLKAHVEGKESIHKAEFRFRTKENKWAWTMSIGRAIEWDEHGAVSKVAGLSLDISNQKQAEFDLATAKEVAEAATKTKSAFLANMSHEIRTPMNAILGMSHLALKTELTNQQVDYISKIDHAAKNLLGIINDILDFSKIEAGKLSLEKIPFSTEEVLTNLSSMIALKAQEKDLEFLLLCEENVPDTLIGDPLRLGQILLNLCSNAVKFTSKGEIVVTLKQLERSHSDVRIQFSVRDTGIGMTEAQQAKLFESFTQADISTTRKFGGTGLGLAISKHLVEQMNGHFEVHSSENNGSEFIFDALFTIPSITEVSSPLPPIDIRGMHVLVVDDNQASREVLQNMLNAMRFEVTLAASGDEAISCISQKEKPFDVILMDWKMPQKDGIETAREIHALDKTDTTSTIIMVTAYSSEMLMQQAQDEGFNGYLIKPVTASTLLETILEACHKKGYHPQTKTIRQTKENKAYPHIKGAKILLVEDNEINQQIGKELLESQGAEIAIAENGAVALEKAQQEQWSIILMDVQMPVMDGYTASKEIRKEFNADNLPILAMTANAMAGDREKALEAGMQDHITKPIDPNELYEKVNRWINSTIHSSSKGQSKENPKEIELPKELHAIKGLDVADGLNRVGGNKALYLKTIERFVESQTNLIEQIEAALEASKQDDAVRFMHTMKGLAGTLGAEELFSLAELEEKKLMEGQKEYAFSPQFIEEFTTIIEELDKAIPHTAPEKNSVEPNTSDDPIDLSHLSSSFEQLAQLLSEDDTKALKVVQEIEEQAPSIAHELQEIQKSLEMFDFEKASDLLDKLCNSKGIELP